MDETNKTIRPSDAFSYPSLPDTNSLPEETIVTRVEDAINTTDAVARGEIGSAKQDSTSELQVKEPSNKRVLVVGSVGAGKSSLINMLAGQLVTPVGAGAHCCTQKIVSIPIKHNGVEYEFIDSPGLEGISGVEITADNAIPKLILFLALEQQNFNCVLFVWRKGRISNAFGQNTQLLKNRLIKGPVPFILVVTGCETEEDLTATRTSLHHELKEFSFNSIVCGTTLFGGVMEHYMSGIREIMTAELWKCIEQSCDSSFIDIRNSPGDPLSEEQNNPLWWRIIQTFYQYLAAGYEMGKSVVEEYLYVTPAQDGRGVHVTDTPPGERDNQ